MELRDVFRFNSKHLLGSLNPTLTFYFKCRKHRKTFFKCFLHLKRNSISESSLEKIGMGTNRCPHESKWEFCVYVWALGVSRETTKESFGCTRAPESLRGRERKLWGWQSEPQPPDTWMILLHFLNLNLLCVWSVPTLVIVSLVIKLNYQAISALKLAERPFTLVEKKKKSFQFDLGRTVTVSQDWWEEHGAFRSHPAGQEPGPRQSKVVELSRAQWEWQQHWPYGNYGKWKPEGRGIGLLGRTPEQATIG